MAINLSQNPLARPMLSSLVPTLLKNSHMWILMNPTSENEDDERPLFAKDTCDIFSHLLS